MAASVESKQEDMSSGETKEKENSDDLSLFVDFNDSNLNLKLLQNSDKFQETLDSESGNPMLSKTISIMHGQKNPSADDLLNSETTTTDYDWLLSPPRNPEFSRDMEEQKTLPSQNLRSNGQSTASESRQETPLEDGSSTIKVAPRHPAATNGVKSSGAIRRPSPSRKATPTGSRSATPTTRPTLPSTTKPLRSSTPTVATTKPVAPSKRSTTPTLRPSTIAASKSTSRSSTPTHRPSILAASKSTTSRSSTPTHRSSNPSGLPSTTMNGVRSSSATKSRLPSSRGNSPSVKSRPSTEAPPNLKKSLPERPAKAIPKRSSCSPSRGQQVSNVNSVRSGLTRSRGYSNGDDDVNPVLMGTKMVERVVNMRKLAPPKQDHLTNQSNTSGKLSMSQDNSGFGRTLSKKSFDMALRHLDIRRSMPGNMRAMITKVPASSVYSVRSESAKPQTVSVSDSPLATSSSASSDHNPGHKVDEISLGNENGRSNHHHHDE